MSKYFFYFYRRLKTLIRYYNQICLFIMLSEISFYTGILPVLIALFYKLEITQTKNENKLIHSSMWWTCHCTYTISAPWAEAAKNKLLWILAVQLTWLLKVNSYIIVQPFSEVRQYNFDTAVSKLYCLPSEKGCTLRGKNLLPVIL